MTDNTDTTICEVYRVVFRCAAWKTKSERYYTASSAAEAFEDLYHSFHRGRVAAMKITVYDVEHYDRYSNLWVSRYHDVLQELDPEIIKTLVVKPSKIVMRRG